VVALTFISVIVRKLTPQARSLHANRGVEARVELVSLTVNRRADYVFLDGAGAAFESLADDVKKELGQPVGAFEFLARHDLGALRPNVGVAYA
jgi:hypothetical protein